MPSGRSTVCAAHIVAGVRHCAGVRLMLGVLWLFSVVDAFELSRCRANCFAFAQPD